MKPIDLQWVGQPVFKLAMDCHGHETQIRGKVVKYCPSSARYLLMYADGSSDGVPVDEIEDHVPMLLQLPVKRRRSISKCQRAAAQSEEPAECHEPAVQPPKRLKVSADMQAVVSRFINHLVRADHGSRHQRRKTTNAVGHFGRLHGSGNGGGVFSPKPTRLKEQHAPHKREQKARKPRSLRPKKTPTCRRIEEDSLPEKVPVVVDLTGDGSEEEDDEEIDDTPSARRRLHFGLNSTVLFDMRDSVDVFSWQLTRTGQVAKAEPEAWKPAKRGGAASVNALLADPRMREIAKQMGLQPKISRYESFINEQLQDGPPPPPSESSSDQATNDATAPRFFTPDPGFVVKCNMFHSIKCQQKETKLFLNICAHKLIDAPKNPNSGLEVPEDTRAVPNTNSLQVPLVVGKLREITDFSGALAVPWMSVNPWVLRRSEWDANFKREVMKLAVQWVQEDAKVRLVTPSGKFIKAQYKGGVTVGSEIITSKFRIEDADPTKQRMESPTDLLKQINLDEAKQDTLNLRRHRERDGDETGEEGLIEELPSPSSKQKTAQSSQSMKTNTTAKSAPNAQRKKKSGAVRRGFLNSTKSELYPKGSSEGRPSSRM
ncbi:PIH1 family [Phytophthora cactorum]|nr:PIH1 family [Phytophthora cactorum]